MHVEISSGYTIKLINAAGNTIARADAYTGHDGNDNDPHWLVIQPKSDGSGCDWLAPCKRVATEEAAASVLAMIAVMHTLSVS